MLPFGRILGNSRRCAPPRLQRLGSAPRRLGGLPLRLLEHNVHAELVAHTRSDILVDVEVLLRERHDARVAHRLGHEAGVEEVPAGTGSNRSVKNGVHYKINMFVSCPSVLGC